MKFRMSYCYNIQNTDQPYIFSLIQIKIVRKICFMTCRLIIQRLVQEIVLLVLHRCPIINRILHVRLWIRILIFSCSRQYREGVRYRFEHSKIKFVSTCGHVISSLTISSSVRIRRVFLCMYKLVC